MIAAGALLLVVIAAGLIGTLFAVIIMLWIDRIKKEWKRRKKK